MLDRAANPVRQIRLASPQLVRMSSPTSPQAASPNPSAIAAQRNPPCFPWLMLVNLKCRLRNIDADIRNALPSMFRLELFGILFLVKLGIALRLRQYLFNRSLWFDEASLALNVVDRDVTTLLTEPLAYLQTAPPGFLVAARSMVVALGPFDWALRLVPFIAGVSVVLLAVLLARRELTSTVGRLTFVGLVALSPVLIFYSSEFKQYSSDALAAIAILVVFSSRSSPYGTLLLAGTGLVALVCSLPAIFVAAPAGFFASVRGRALASVQAAPIRRSRMAGRGRAAWRLYLGRQVPTTNS